MAVILHFLETIIFTKSMKIDGQEYSETTAYVYFLKIEFNVN